MKSLKNIDGVTVMVAAVLAAFATGATSHDGASLFGADSASVTFGPYARFEFGSAEPMLNDAYWLPPGASDPVVDFDAVGERAGFGAFALGYDWQNGVRAEMALFGTGTSDVVASCAGASDGSDCSTHADITDASVRTRGVMANVFYAPLEAMGSDARLQPFLVVGLGIAQNEVSEWTRENPTSDAAWSVGVGASLQISRPGKWPILVEAAWRHYDFGTASGGAEALPGDGNHEPRQPFTFETSQQVISLGIRIPLQRY